jgi:competence protein ComEC
VTYAGRALLFPGDIELAGELALLERHDDGAAVSALIMKAPHHCSRTSSSESLISAVSPTWVICSTGRNNRFGFPHAEVLARYRERGSQTFSTAEQGAITVSITPKGAVHFEALAQDLHFPLATPELQR